MRGPGDLRLDPARTIRAAAGIGLAVLGISLLPDLLTPKEPEPLPADVGFRPDENLGPAALPTPMPAPPAATATERGRPRTGRKLKEAAADRTRGRQPTGRTKKGRGTKGTGNRPGQGRQPPRAVASRDRPAEPPPARDQAPPPAPVWTPPPAPPAPQPPPPAPVGDGSIEFAPR